MTDVYEHYNLNFISADGSIKSIAALAHNLRKMNFFSTLIDEGEQQFKCLFIEVNANNITILNNEYLKYDSFMLLLNFLVHGHYSEHMNSPYALRAFKEAANFCQAEGVLKTFINQQKANISAAQFINAHYPAQLIYNAYKEQLNAESLIGEFLKYPCYSEILICGLGYTANQLQKNNICLDAVVQANCFSHKEVISAYASSNAIEFINAGISIKALAQYGHQGYGLKETQYSTIELKGAGFNSKQLKTAGFTAGELKQAGFTAVALKESGFAIEELKAGCFSAVELKEADFELCQLKRVNFTACQLKAADFTASELKDVGFSARQLKAAGFDDQQLISSLFSAKDLINAGSNVSQLTSTYLSYFKSKKLKLTTIFMMGLYDSSVGWREITDIRQQAQYYDELISREVLERCGFGEECINILNIKARVSHRKYSLDDGEPFDLYHFKPYYTHGYYNVREVLAIYFKKNGVSVKELIEAGFSVSHLKAAAYPLNEITLASYRFKEIRQSQQYIPTIHQNVPRQ